MELVATPAWQSRKKKTDTTAFEQIFYFPWRNFQLRTKLNLIWVTFLCIRFDSYRIQYEHGSLQRPTLMTKHVIWRKWGRRGKNLKRGKWQACRVPCDWRKLRTWKRKIHVKRRPWNIKHICPMDFKVLWLSFVIWPCHKVQARASLLFKLQLHIYRAGERAILYFLSPLVLQWRLLCILTEVGGAMARY
jgi:hypothetical protein